jgi:hypothetical protein
MHGGRGSVARLRKDRNHHYRKETRAGRQSAYCTSKGLSRRQEENASCCFIPAPRGSTTAMLMPMAAAACMRMDAAAASAQYRLHDLSLSHVPWPLSTPLGLLRPATTSSSPSPLQLFNRCTQHELLVFFLQKMDVTS